MTKYKYNEKAYAEEIERKGFLTQYRSTELKILVKYYKSSGLKASERKQKIYEFCEKHIKNFKKELYFRQINSVLRYGEKKTSKLIMIESIPITVNEIEYIMAMDVHEVHKKIAFTLLVQKKINNKVIEILHPDQPLMSNTFGGKTNNYKEIIEMAKVPSCYKEKINGELKKVKTNIHSIINELYKNGYIDRIGESKSKGKIGLSFLGKIAPTEEISFYITTYDDIGYYYDRYNGDKKIINCLECQRLIRVTNNRKKYCDDCAKITKNEQNKGYYNDRKIENT